jgi:vacuolar iron transporter family protein
MSQTEKNPDLAQVSGLGIWFSGLRQLPIGFAAAEVTYGIGKLIGVAVTG